MSKVKMYVTVTFPEHSEKVEDSIEPKFVESSVHKFSYEWKSKHHREDTPDNRDIIIKLIKEDRADDIDMKIKQVISMYQQTTGATNTKHLVDYSVDFNA